MMEATSFGVPVVATDVGGVGEIVVDGVNGVLLPSDPEPHAIAEAIHRLAILPDDRWQEMCRQARTQWEKSYSASDNYRSFVAELLSDA